MHKTLVAAAFLVLGGMPALAGDIVLGAVLPLSGASATVGDDQRRGIELALDQINEKGGVLGSKLRVIVEDSGGRTPSALDAAKKLVTVDKAPVVIGEYSSGITIPIGQYLVQEGRVHLNISSSSGRIRALGEGAFSLIGLDNVSAGFAAQDVIDNKWKKAAIIVPNNAYGQGVVEQFKKAFSALGGDVASVVMYMEGQTTYRRELQQLERGGPDVYVYSAYGKEAATINREAFELGLSARPWYGIYLSMCTSDSEARFVQGQYGMDINAVGPDGQAYEAAYRKKYGEPLRTSYGAYGYDAVMMSAAAIGKAGSLEPKGIAVALKQIGQDYHGATGDITFDVDRQRFKQPYLRLKIQDGIKRR
jgi:branched-chain amino acid transport system substrate-binding protein